MFIIYKIMKDTILRRELECQKMIKGKELDERWVHQESLTEDGEILVQKIKI